jgi:hypothetical protein
MSNPMNKWVTCVCVCVCVEHIDENIVNMHKYLEIYILKK